MAIETFALQAGTYGAEVSRRAWLGGVLRRGATVGSIEGGLVGATDLAITIGSGLHIKAAAGEVFVPGSSSATQGGYYFRNTASAEFTLSTADPSNPRVDTLIARIHDAAYTGAENNGVLEVLAGTPTSGANLTNLSGKAAVPASSYVIGYALVPAGASTPSEVKTVAKVAQSALGGRYEEGTLASRPSAGVAGRLYFATDTPTNGGGLYRDTGAAWAAIPTMSNAAGARTVLQASSINYGPTVQNANRPCTSLLEVTLLEAAPKSCTVEVGGAVFAQFGITANNVSQRLTVPIPPNAALQVFSIAKLEIVQTLTVN